ncbi:exopolysaccharide biosynthesis WecB/TagA/CpsF family protein [Rhizomicrobium palustre]|uniref:Exopolysaccharide biosynthesis WecB/TagA/CpsF family protein n=1 Tax=Rhizomicrobium palustre TaxID=189966 RepID=A0A846MYU0_9PROT|nr:WecB/TagA/CpsF family glycosyltransferase [Rhizomicrobium palustre]NIK88473.1 exopolysaccharide biosynthesis WecB/TagA/CpsF family protein [Rhizomicrobium palustre]
MRTTLARKADPAAAPMAHLRERRSGARVYSRATVGGLPTACVSRQQLVQVMVGDCLAAREGNRAPKLVFASNGHAIAMAAMDMNFRELFHKADLIHADGEPVVFASKLLAATPVPERSATTDFIFDAAKAAGEHGLKFYLLGSTEEINARAVEKLKEAYPGVEIVGRRNGYFSRDDEAAICEDINASGADVLWVGLGVPFEYEFTLRNKMRLKAGWVVTCGGCFNFAAGDYVRAPGWMQKTGLEWLHRLWREPRRLFWRYAITNPVAIAMLAMKTS